MSLWRDEATRMPEPPGRLLYLGRETITGPSSKELTPLAVPIPADFDYLKEQIDISEHAARDAFHFNVENWARFRWTIAVGNESSHLSGTSISDDVKAAYRELGKCHHEVVSSLAYCGLSLIPLPFANLFVIQKAVKDFYFHGGALLDNLSRLIYVVNVAAAASAKSKKGYVRHEMHRSQLIRDHSADVPNYIPHINSLMIQEFVSTRNAVAHYWKIPFRGADLQWPRDQLKDKAFAWHYDEAEYHKYTGWTPMADIINEHLRELEKAQNEIFGLLVADIAVFEKNNGVQIV
jgi:hypothetical protein